MVDSGYEDTAVGKQGFHVAGLKKRNHKMDMVLELDHLVDIPQTELLIPDIAGMADS